MKNILKLDSPNDYAQFVEAPVLHPLVSIIHYDELAPFRHSLNNYGVYALFRLVDLRTTANASPCVDGCFCGRPSCFMALIWNTIWTDSSISPISSPTPFGWNLPNGSASPNSLPRCDRN